MVNVSLFLSHFSPMKPVCNEKFNLSSLSRKQVIVEGQARDNKSFQLISGMIWGDDLGVLYTLS